MARRRRRSAKCKNITICGKRRKVCWNSKGKITSNRPAGSSGRRRKKASSKRRRTTSGGWKRVSRAAATVKSGKRKGKLKKGCKFVRGDGALCRTSTKTSRRRKSTKRRSTRKRRCKFGVNKNTGRCLKTKRRRR